MTTSGDHPLVDDGGARRRRPVLLSLTAAGVVVGLLGLAGVFAVSTDRATTGENRYETDALEEEVALDLLIADRNDDGTCGTFSDDLVTGILDAEVGVESVEATFVQTDVCLKNAGAGVGRLEMLALDLDDRDVACSGSEGTFDSSCGGDHAGELSAMLAVSASDCDTSAELNGSWLDYLGIGRMSLTTLGPGDTLELCVPLGLTANTDQLRIAQTDAVSWRFAFDLIAEDGCMQRDIEPNGTAAVATQTLVTDVPTHGSICEDDVDYFRIEHSGPPVDVIVTFNPFDGDVDLRLEDESGVLVDSSGSSTSSTEKVTISDDGTFYLKVFGYTTNGVGFPPATNPHYTVVLTPNTDA